MARHLTDAIVKRLLAPDTGNNITYDDDVVGFGCRVTAGGARSWILNYRTRSGRERRYTIGSATNWRATAARAEAKRLKRLIEEGQDPLADREDARTAPTVGDLIDRFEQEHLPRKRASTAGDYKRMIENHIRPALKHLKVSEVAFADIDRLHRKITTAGHRYRANRVIAVVSKMFALAIRWGMRDSNPCRGIERNYESKRKRYLSGDELTRLTAALAEHPDQQAANVIRLLLMSGARRGEVLGMRWADIDLGAGIWTKPGSTTKQKTDHSCPLSAPARQLLSEIRDEQIGKHRRLLGEYVFPGNGGSEHIVNIKRAWRRICKAANIDGLRIHDLRHSFASQLASGGASLPLIGALLGHSNPTTTHRYAHLFDDPQRAAVERVGAIIAAAGHPAKKPTSINKRRGA
jgi:integrase